MRQVRQRVLGNPNRIGAIGGASILPAFVQSPCAAVFAVSGVRLAIGLTALAAVSGIGAPARCFEPKV
jgi:hypothetical protein